MSSVNHGPNVSVHVSCRRHPALGGTEVSEMAKSNKVCKITGALDDATAEKSDRHTPRGVQSAGTKRLPVLQSLWEMPSVSQERDLRLKARGRCRLTSFRLAPLPKFCTSLDRQWRTGQNSARVSMRRRRSKTASSAAHVDARIRRHGRGLRSRFPWLGYSQDPCRQTSEFEQRHWPSVPRDDVPFHEPERTFRFSVRNTVRSETEQPLVRKRRIRKHSQLPHRS